MASAPRLIDRIHAIYLKLVHGRKLFIKDYGKLILGPRLLLVINKAKNAKLTINGSFWCRRDAVINIHSGEVVLEDGVFFNHGVSINCHKRISIGRNTIFGENVKVYDHDHLFENGVINRTGFVTEEIVIGENVWIGTGVIIMKGTTIGNGTVVGAGTILKGNIEGGVVVYDQRVKKIKKWSEIKQGLPQPETPSKIGGNVK